MTHTHPLLPSLASLRRRGSRPRSPEAHHADSVGVLRRFLALFGVLAVTACGAAPEPEAAEGDAPRPAADDQDGWVVLVDAAGGELSHWRGYQRDDVPPAWRVEDGVLTLEPGRGEGGDLVTRETFGDFELELEWRVAEGGNSGIFYRGTEDEPWIHQTAPELQLLDNDGHADGESPLTSAGSNFGLYAVEDDVTRPVGEWNHARIVARGDEVEHWLNGTLVVAYELGSPEWEERVAGSKFAAWPSYGQAREGHIGLQDHGDPVWFRDIRVRRLEQVNR